MQCLRSINRNCPWNLEVIELSAKENKTLNWPYHFQFDDQEMKTLGGVYSQAQNISSSLSLSGLRGRLWSLKARSDSKSSWSAEMEAWWGTSAAFLVSLLGGKDKENSKIMTMFFYQQLQAPQLFALKRNTTDKHLLKWRKEVCFVTFPGS
jgi:hypothetical protein